MDLKHLKEKLLQFVDIAAKSLGVELRVLVWIAFSLGFFVGKFLG
jgi:hypothetical protein